MSGSPFTATTSKGCHSSARRQPCGTLVGMARFNGEGLKEQGDKPLGFLGCALCSLHLSAIV